MEGGEGGMWRKGSEVNRTKRKKLKGEKSGKAEGKGCVLRVKGEAVDLLVRDRGVPAYMHQLPMLHYLREKLNRCRSLEG